MDITWQQSQRNENLFRCLLDGKIQLGYIVKSAAPLLPDTKIYGYWADDGRMFSMMDKAQEYVVAKATSPKLD